MSALTTKWGTFTVCVWWRSWALPFGVTIQRGMAEFSAGPLHLCWQELTEWEKEEIRRGENK